MAASQALCTEAALNAVQRRYPQIYKTNDRLLLKPETIEVELRDFMIAIKSKTCVALPMLTDLTEGYVQSWYHHPLALSHLQLHRCRRSLSHCYNCRSRR